MQTLNCDEEIKYAKGRISEIKKELIKINIGEIIIAVIVFMILILMYYAVFASSLLPTPFNDIWFLNILLVSSLALYIQYVIHTKPSEKRRQLEIAKAELMEISSKCNIEK